nr:uncharacterized mitochondrial protein AtMg00810-like [Tanacetum cinerariifolium]
MADNRTMAQMLQAPIEGYEDAIVVPPINANNFELKQTLINLDALNSAAGGNFLDKIPRECLSIIESKSKVRYSRSRVTDVRANANANLSSQSNSFDLQQIAAALEDKLDIRMNRDDGIFISQDKYVADILKKFYFYSVKKASTPIETNKALLKDKEAEDVDVHLYKSMIGSLMYLTASKPDITFVVCACARFQVTPKVSHLHALKRIFRYIKGQPKLGLWYPKDSPFDLEAFSNSDYAGASLDRKSTTRDGISDEFKVKTGSPKVNAARQNLFWATAKSKTVNDVKQIHVTVDGKTVVISESSLRSDLHFNDDDGEDDRVVRATTTATSLEAEQESGSGPRCQDTTLGDADAQTRFDSASKQSHDPPLSKINTSRSGEDSMEYQDGLID